MTLFPSTSDAIFGPPGDESSPWRYVLTRRWGSSPAMVVIGVNPSTATATTDDPTIRRCIRFARDAGHGGLTMLNLFAWRAADVRELGGNHGDVVGPDNDMHLRVECGRAGVVVCAWGARGKLPPWLRKRPDDVVSDLTRCGVRLHVLRLTARGEPEHPLYLPASCRPEVWSGYAG